MAAPAKESFEQQQHQSPSLDSMSSPFMSRLYDVIECPICTEVMTKPKFLPCLHTFCENCIVDYSKKSPGKDIACPMCRKEVPIPQGGYESLPRNFFVEKLLDVENKSKIDTQTVECDICIEDNDDNSMEADFADLSMDSPGLGGNTSTGKADTSRPVNGRSGGAEKRALAHCFDCRQNLCEPCHKHHKRQTATKSHNTMYLGRPLKPEQLKKLDSTFCLEHKQEQVKMYCSECKIVVCLVCYVEVHGPKNHPCTHIDKRSEEFNERLETDIRRITEHVARGTAEIETMETGHNEFCVLMSTREKEITDKCEEVKRIAEEHAKKLLDEIASAREKRQLDVENLKTEVKGHLVALETFNKYASELQNKGTSVDIARGSEDMHRRTEELLALDVRPSGKKLNDVIVKFTPTDTVKLIGGPGGGRGEGGAGREGGNEKNVVGRVDIKETNKNSPSSDVNDLNDLSSSSDDENDDVTGPAVQPNGTPGTPRSSGTPKSPGTPVTPGTPVSGGGMTVVARQGACVRGVTTLGREMFVARTKSPDIEVYDVTTYNPTRTIKVTGCNPCDMSSVAQTSQLVISDFQGCMLYVVGTTTDPPKINKWGTGEKPDGVSTSGQEIIVAFREVRKLKLYNLVGQLLREISPKVDTPVKFRHAWRLAGTHSYLVCHGYDSAYGFIIVDDSGKILKKTDASALAPPGELKIKQIALKDISPNHVAVDSRGMIYANDFYNNSVMLIDSELKTSKLFIQPKTSGLATPFRLHLNETLRLLYIGEHSAGGRVLAVNI